MEITQAHVDKLNELLDAGLVQGVGVPVPGEMCVEAAVCYALGLPHGDDPGCVVDSVRRLKIILNDSHVWQSNISRAEGLRRLAIAQLGSRDTVDEKELLRQIRFLVRDLKEQYPAADSFMATAVHDYYSATAAAPSNAAAYAAAYVASVAGFVVATAAATANAGANAIAFANAIAEAIDAHASAAANAAAYASAATIAVANSAANAIAEAIDAYPTLCATNSPARVAGEKILCDFAEGVVQILIDLKSPGCKFL